MFEFKSVDDVGLGNSEKCSRCILKDDCERQVWNAGAAS